MKTSQIKTFLSVVRNGSVAAAARELNRSRTTVSTVLASLEDELGVELFERSGNQLHLTAIGQSILTDCRRFDQVASQIRARCQHHLSGAESVLRIARDDAIPEDIQVQRFAIHVGRDAQDQDLIDKGVALIEKHNPAEAEAVKRFLDGRLGGPRRPPR